jgi:hypothetical protein
MIKINTIKTPRGIDGGLNVTICNMCGAGSGALSVLNFLGGPEICICKGCLLGVVKEIDKKILEN